jgi:hypothetical protein
LIVVVAWRKIPTLTFLIAITIIHGDVAGSTRFNEDENISAAGSDQFATDRTVVRNL